MELLGFKKKGIKITQWPRQKVNNIKTQWYGTYRV